MRSNEISPKLQKFRKPSAEDFECVTNIQDVFCSILPFTLAMDENFLSQKADWVCNLNPSRHSIGFEFDRPGVMKEKLDVPQLLRSDPGDFQSCLVPTLAVV